MKLHPPFTITARLAPGIKIGDSFLSLLRIDEAATPDGRDQAVFVLDTPEFEYEISDLSSGCQGFTSMVSTFASLLAYMDAAADAYRYEMRTGAKSDNHDIFPAHVMEWCYDNEDEIASLGCDLQDEDGAVNYQLIEEV